MTYIPNVPAALNVRVYGARGDGVTDDTTALQAALTAAGTAGGGEVFAPGGTYLFQPTLSVPANVVLRGAGRGVTTFRRKVTGVQGNLFSIQLAGHFAGIRDCSVRGRWDPLDPTTQTYEGGVTVYGADITYCWADNVEVYNCHLGFWIGGIIGDATYTWGGQNHTRFTNCYAHDTYDLGFSIVAKDRTSGGTCTGTQIVNCTQHDSYATAGMEIRYQQNAEVVGFNARDNTNSALGAGIRLEETNGATITNLQTTGCYMGLQHVHDSYDCVVSGWVSDADEMALYSRHSADLTISNFVWKDSNRTAGLLAYLDGTSWTRNNERITLTDGFILEPAYGVSFGYGLYVVGTGYTEANLANNGLGLRMQNVWIRGANGNGTLIEAGGNFRVTQCTFEDNIGTGTDGVGLVVNPPNPNGVTSTTKPANGWVNDNTFINTGVQPYPYGEGTGNGDGKHLTRLGRFNIIGSFTNLGGTGIQSTVAQITANKNDYDPSDGIQDVWRLSSDAARDITGIAARILRPHLRLINVGAQNIVLKHQSASSSANNRFLCNNAGTDVTLLPDQSATLEYDCVTLRWRVVATSA